MTATLKNKGVALFIALSLSFLLSISVVVILLTAYNHTNVTENLTRRIRAIALAEAGVYHATWQLKNNGSYTGESFDAGEGVLSDIPSGTGWSMVITVDDYIYPAYAGKRIRSKVDYPKAAVP